MRELAVVFSVGRYLATIHYKDCAGYQRCAHPDLPLPLTVKVRICRHCRPTKEDILANPPRVAWDPTSHNRLQKWTPARNPVVRVNQEIPTDNIEAVEALAIQRGLL